MTVATLPDVERLVVQWLLAQSEVSALVGETTGGVQSVYSTLPDYVTGVLPLLLVELVGGPGPLFPRPLVAEAARLQCSALANRKAEARQLAATARAVLSERIVGSHTEGLVENVEIQAARYLPDDGLNHLPRYIFDVIVTTRIGLSP